MSTASVNSECPAFSQVNYPEVRNANTLAEFVNKQLEYYTDVDPIYCFNRNHLNTSAKGYALKSLCDFNDAGGAVIAGSKAVKFLSNILDRLSEWEPKDTDVFFLGSDSEFRYDLEAVDIVAKKAKDVASLLAGFDLPCCRVAYNKSYVWASLQALRAILTGHYSAPAIYQKMTGCYLSKGFSCNNAHRLASKFYERVAKYNARGFTINYDMLIYNTTFIERLDLDSFNYSDDIVEPKKVPKIKLVDMDHKPKAVDTTNSQSSELMSSSLLKPIDINSTKPVETGTTKSIEDTDSVIDIILTKVAKLLVNTNKPTVVDVMRYLVTVDRDQRLKLLNLSIRSYSGIDNCNFFDFMQLVHKLM